MIKKILLIFILILNFTSARSEITNKSIIDSKVRGKESISIAVTPLTEKKQIKEFLSVL